ncbi:hypothetical protein BGAL_0171g00090 [Botrytis galanthina]|uniref:Uncharacterized protein n=1 Tax=Botrytis galanthina TaxID=278940 RepID=A0A4S8R1Q9_9HELO|nr:hypothetical protein BGAL_0171g00090 [Botrytis galanthina]
MEHTVEIDDEVLLAILVVAREASSFTHLKEILLVIAQNAYNTELQESSSQLCGALRMISRGAGPKRNAVCGADG